jgi:hypothetical protein
MTLMLVIPTTAMSAKGGNGNGGGGGGGSTTGDIVDFGDVFGDLMHVLRDELTGQPIFAQRWVEMPAELPGWGWGYCAIGIDELGAEIPFKPYSCDLEVGDDPELSPVVEVDYFGRLNASRVQERNMRMHLNETITNINQAGMLGLDPTGRLELGFESEDNVSDPFVPLCVSDGDPGNCVWSTIDSPMENLALYRRMLKYGHLSTDPEEPDLWWNGDPATPEDERVHPALTAADFDKFEDAGLESMVPPKNCWNGDKYVPACAATEFLTAEDFSTSATFLGAAAGKHNFITDHLVQYVNRFLRITQSTDFALATKKVLPALFRTCFFEEDPWEDGEEVPEGYDLDTDLNYSPPDSCIVGEVSDSITNYDKFTNVQEEFVDFGASAYVRDSVWGGASAKLAIESTPGLEADSWGTSNVSLLAWVELANPATPAVVNIANFVDAASDALRAIEFIHNYEIPENLYCIYAFDTEYCPTTL